MGIFKMLSKTGEHTERDTNGVEHVYKAGDTLESDRDLVKRFPNKFIRLDAETVLGGNVPQPRIPVPHRFIKDDVLVEPTPDTKSDVKSDEKVVDKDKDDA